MFVCVHIHICTPIVPMCIVHSNMDTGAHTSSIHMYKYIYIYVCAHALVQNRCMKTTKAIICEDRCLADSCVGGLDASSQGTVSKVKRKQDWISF